MSRKGWQLPLDAGELERGLDERLRHQRRLPPCEGARLVKHHAERSRPGRGHICSPSWPVRIGTTNQRVALYPLCNLQRICSKIAF